MSKYSAEVLADSPIVYWRFGELTGATTAVDASGNGRSGTYVGSPALEAVGLIGGDTDKSVNLNGTSHYITRATETIFDFLGTQPFTLEAWVLITVAAVGVERIIMHEKTAAPDEGWSLSHSNIEITFQRCANGVCNWSIHSVPIPPGERTHIVCVFTGTQMLLYRNGVQVASSGATSSLIAQVQPLRVGSNSDAVGVFHMGQVDEVAIYNTALSAARIKAHYDAAEYPNYVYGEAESEGAAPGVRFMMDNPFTSFFSRTTREPPPPIITVMLPPARNPQIQTMLAR